MLETAYLILETSYLLFETVDKVLICFIRDFDTFWIRFWPASGIILKTALEWITIKQAVLNK